jgi:hypothetical protein
VLVVATAPASAAPPIQYKVKSAKLTASEILIEDDGSGGRYDASSKLTIDLNNPGNQSAFIQLKAGTGGLASAAGTGSVVIDSARSGGGIPSCQEHFETQLDASITILFDVVGGKVSARWFIPGGFSSAGDGPRTCPPAYGWGIVEGIETVPKGVFKKKTFILKTTGISSLSQSFHGDDFAAQNLQWDGEVKLKRK